MADLVGSGDCTRARVRTGPNPRSAWPIGGPSWRYPCAIVESRHSTWLPSAGNRQVLRPNHSHRPRLGPVHLPHANGNPISLTGPDLLPAYGCWLWQRPRPSAVFRSGLKSLNGSSTPARGEAREAKSRTWQGEEACGTIRTRKYAKGCLRQQPCDVTLVSKP